MLLAPMHHHQLILLKMLNNFKVPFYKPLKGTRNFISFHGNFKYNSLLFNRNFKSISFLFHGNFIENSLRSNFLRPTMVQRYSVPIILELRDLIAVAQTGNLPHISVGGFSEVHHTTIFSYISFSKIHFFKKICWWSFYLSRG